MKQLQLPRVLLSAAAVATMLAAAGCATTPPSATRMSIAPMGTVDTYHRKSSGSLGNFDGRVVWTYAPATWQDKPAISFGSPQAGVGLYDPGTFAMLANLDAAGRPQLAFDPPMDYRWPLEVGKEWTSAHRVTAYASGQVVPITVQWKVESWEDVTVPAGTFKAFKVVSRSSLGEIETRWVNPQQALPTIKRHVERPQSYPQGPGVLDAELLSRTPPAK